MRSSYEYTNYLHVVQDLVRTPSQSKSTQHLRQRKRCVGILLSGFVPDCEHSSGAATSDCARNYAQPRIADLQSVTCLQEDSKKTGVLETLKTLCGKASKGKVQIVSMSPAVLAPARRGMAAVGRAAHEHRRSAHQSTMPVTYAKTFSKFVWKTR